MKIRLGFISNSSNTSFCIYGRYFDLKDITDEMIIELEELDLEVIGDQNNDGYYIGRSYTLIKDNETGKEFKERTLKDMKIIFPELEVLHNQEDGWYNG